MLKHHRPIHAGAVRRHAIDAYLAARLPLEPADDTQQRGLAAARCADHGYELVGGDCEVDVLQRHGAARWSREYLGEPGNGDPLRPSRH